MLIDICLPKFDIYQGAVAPNCFKNHTNILDVLFIYLFIYLFFKLSDFPEIYSNFNNLPDSNTLIINKRNSNSFLKDTLRP